MADIDLMPEEFRQRIDEMEKAGRLVYINGDEVVSPKNSKFIGVAIEDSKRLGDVCDMDDYNTQVDMFPYNADDTVVKVAFKGVVHGKMPYSSGLYITDADTAMKTLPRIVQRMIYRYAKWRLRRCQVKRS